MFERSRLVIYQCKKCKRVWAIDYSGNNPKCPDCGNDSIYVVAI